MEVMMSDIDFDCELKIDGFDNIGDSKRKSYEGQLKCTTESPSIYMVNHGSAVVGAMNGRMTIDDIQVSGVCQDASNLRQAVMSDKTKFSSIIINRFAKIQGNKEEKVTQTITLSQASITQLNIDDRQKTVGLTISYEKIEIKDFKVNSSDGTLGGSPIVTSYDRLTGEVNA